MSERSGWLPPEAVVPAELLTDRVLLRPLLAADVDRDYDAVMSSRAMLRTWSQSEWPAEGFTRAENLADLERHEREHLGREAFTFTVLDRGSDRCVGCVYVVPLRDVESAWGRGARAPARVGFWVRSSEIAGDLDAHLLDALRDWFRKDWAFDRVVLTTSPGDRRQVALLEAAGLPPLGVVTRADGRRLLGYDGSGRA